MKYQKAFRLENKQVIYNGDWIAEPKIDGLRGKLTENGIYSSLNNKWGFPHKNIEALNSVIKQINENTNLDIQIDGEFDTDFDLPHHERRYRTMSILKKNKILPSDLPRIIFHCFDIITPKLKLDARKRVLEKLLPLLWVSRQPPRIGSSRRRTPSSIPGACVCPRYNLRPTVARTSI